MWQSLIAGFVIIALCPDSGSGANQSTSTPGRGMDIESRSVTAGGGTSKWAVIIGVNLYLDRTIPSLRFAVADAELMAKTLVDKCGYPEDHVLVMTDSQDETLKPALVNLYEEVPRFLAKPGVGDTVIVFFSGHGFPDDEGQTYLAPKDCQKKRMGLSGLRVDEVSNWLKLCKAQRKLLVLDCCHSGGKDGTAVGSSGQEIADAFGQAAGLITLASCKKDEQSFEWDEKKHGVFTYFLVEGLSGAADKDANGVVDSDEVYNYVWQKVPDQARRMATRQTPVRHVPRETLGIFELARIFHTLFVDRAGAMVQIPVKRGC
jgi:uncharacterized caspase-like protein